MVSTEQQFRTNRGPAIATAAAGTLVAEPGVRAPGPGIVEAQTDSAVGYAAEAVVPAHLLDGGEVVILAIKPSPWFVLFRSIRWLAGLLLVALFAPVVGDGFGWSGMLNQAVGVAFVLVVGLTVLQWVSRLYVLTNRRMMRFHGIFSVGIFETPLTDIEEVTLSVAAYERVTRLGTLFFEISDDPTAPTRWSHIARPREVHRQVTDAIRRARNRASHRDL